MTSSKKEPFCMKCKVAGREAHLYASTYKHSAGKRTEHMGRVSTEFPLINELRI